MAAEDIIAAGSPEAFAANATAEVLSGLFNTPAGSAKGGVLFTSPINVNVGQDVDDNSKEAKTFDLVKTVLYILGVYLVVRQFSPGKPKKSKTS